MCPPSPAHFCNRCSKLITYPNHMSSFYFEHMVGTWGTPKEKVTEKFLCHKCARALEKTLDRFMKGEKNV